MKKSYIFGMAMIIALAFASCGSNKQVVNNQPQQQTPYQPPVQQPTATQPLPAEELPCGSYYDDDDFIRDLGIATSANLNAGQKASFKNAKDNLRQHLGEYVEGLTKTYAKQYSVSTEEIDDIVDKVQNGMKGFVEGMLDRVRKVCSKSKPNGSGLYIFYTAVEVPVMDLKNSMKQVIESVSEDKKWHVDYDEQQFDEIWESETPKMRQNRKNAGY